MNSQLFIFWNIFIQIYSFEEWKSLRMLIRSCWLKERNRIKINRQNNDLSVKETYRRISYVLGLMDYFYSLFILRGYLKLSNISDWWVFPEPGFLNRSFKYCKETQLNFGDRTRLCIENIKIKRLQKSISICIMLKQKNGKFDTEIWKRIIPAVTEGTPM